jgi:hypothetical protein
MLRMCVFIFIVALCGPHLSYAAKKGRTIMLMVGAGGEDQKSETNPDPKNATTTMFDAGFKNAIEGAKAKDWDTRILYDGDRQTGRQIVEGALGSPPERFNQKNFDDQIQKIMEQFERGEITKGDQVLLFINTHGYPLEPGETVHRVDGSQGPVKLDKLRELQAKIQGKVRLGIIDASCYSGSTQTLANSGTCVLSSSRSDQIGYLNFGQTISQAFDNHSSLEGVFIAARNSTHFPSIPVISTKRDENARRILASLKDYVRRPYGDSVAGSTLPETALCDCELRGPAVERLIQEVKLVLELDRSIKTCS